MCLGLSPFECAERVAALPLCSVCSSSAPQALSPPSFLHAQNVWPLSHFLFAYAYTNLTRYGLSGPLAKALLR